MTAVKISKLVIIALSIVFGWNVNTVQLSVGKQITEIPLYTRGAAGSKTKTREPIHISKIRQNHKEQPHYYIDHTIGRGNMWLKSSAVDGYSWLYTVTSDDIRYII